MNMSISIKPRDIGSALGWACGVLFVGTVSCGGNDISCGSGTVQKGNQCVAKAPVVGSGGAADSGVEGGSTPEASAGTGGSTGTGGTVAVDSGPVDHIVFGGATAAAPADPAGTTSPDALLVTWNAASDPLFPTAKIQYEIFTATESQKETYSTAALVAPPGATSILVEGLSGGAPTYFVVRAVSDQGTAKDTNTVEVSGTPKADSTPPTFGGVTDATPVTSSSVLVKWSAATDDMSPAPAITYKVYWGQTAQDTPALAVVTDPGATEAVVTGLTEANTSYYFTVNAVDAAGNVSAASPGLAGETAKDTTPPIFSGCKLSENPTASGGTILWDPATDDTTPASAIKYNIYAFDVPIDHDTSFDTPVQSFTGVTSGLLNTLLSATEYRIVCRAVDSSGNEDQNRQIALLETSSDGTPPTFATGSLTGVADSTSVALTWPQATDDKTPQAAIKYLVFGSTKKGGEDLTNPILVWTGTTGTTVMKDSLLKALPASDAGDQKVSNTDFYFLVEAEDEAGNQSAPIGDVHVKTLVSFADDVQPVFSAHCALSGCHVHPTASFTPPQGQVLEAPYTYDSIVNVVAREGAALNPPEINLKRIDATTPDPTQSYIWRKINGGGAAGNIVQSPMPPAYSTGPQLSQPGDFDIIEGWIVQGAKNN